MYLIWIMLAFLFIYIVMLIRGSASWDRFLGLSLISTKTGIIIVILASINDSTHLLDFVIVCTLLWFMCVIFTAFFILDRIKGEKNDSCG